MNELIRVVEKYTRESDHYETPIKGMAFHRRNSVNEPENIIFPPHFCLICQGAKQIMLDKVEYAYNENNFLLSSVDLPVSSQVVKASEERPYLGITMRLDLVEIAQLLSDENLENVKSKDRAMVVGELSADLMEPMVDRKSVG